MDDKSARLGESRKRLPRGELERRCRDLPPVRSLHAALDPGFASSAGTTPSNRPNPATPPAIIAEFKRRSPSRGVIRARFDLEEIHRAYARGGADAYSVLTEEDHFGGCLEDLRSLRVLAEVPLLRKDFLFDPYQIYESREAGADAVLLIVAALESRRLGELIALSRELTMEPLVEVHCAAELDTALECGAAIVGINNRNLHTFEVDIAVSLELAPGLPRGVTGVSESGIAGPEEIRRLRGAGVRAFLVGEHLMRARDPERALRRLKEAS